MLQPPYIFGQSSGNARGHVTNTKTHRFEIAFKFLLFSSFMVSFVDIFVIPMSEFHMAIFISC